MRITPTTTWHLGLAACLAVLGCGGGGSGNSGKGGTTGSAGTTGGAGTTGSAGTGGTGTDCVMGTNGAGNSGGSRSFEPMSVGATWIYNTTEPADGGVGTVAGTKTVTIQAFEPVPERAAFMAYRIHTLVPAMEDQLTWQAETSTAIVRYRDEIYAPGNVSPTGILSWAYYAPPKLRIDTQPARLVGCVEYQESHTETAADGAGQSTSSKPFKWIVVNGAESITVPAGTFTTVHLRKFNGLSNALDKDYWFTRGVGKVKETSNQGRVEVLMSYNIP